MRPSPGSAKPAVRLEPPPPPAVIRVIDGPWGVAIEAGSGDVVEAVEPVREEFCVVGVLALGGVVALAGQDRDDADAVAAEMCERVDGLSVEEVAEIPSTLIGPADEIADTVRRCRQRWGISYFVVRDHDQFAPVIAQLREAIVDGSRDTRFIELVRELVTSPKVRPRAAVRRP
jgi:hypothetical protein